ncbi:hypothetical protein GQ55_7G075000 [Panicum hallii var. hallii]|uniref:Uncharacterized protein n=1 Tax=Panicum hallii var. hallii TaxID=1504633 RepID=A0A2T7CSU6_9POAL|nr:hypothetical protein GQ55_7G075000 [Panicum hallii var. hallii]
MLQTVHGSLCSHHPWNQVAVVFSYWHLVRVLLLCVGRGCICYSVQVTTGVWLMDSEGMASTSLTSKNLETKKIKQ